MKILGTRRALKKFVDKLSRQMSTEILRTAGEQLLRLQSPQVIQENKSGWMTGEEFARKVLAGVNPGLICRLEEFPPKSKLDSQVYGDQTSKITKQQLEINMELCYHQLVSHWLNTHAVIESFVIATNRQLSGLHPVYKLLDPHYRDTMYSLEMSFKIYKDGEFYEQALPVDLLKRGLVESDPASPNGIRLVIEDYPYVVDGLDVYFAIYTWVQDYISFYYKTQSSNNGGKKLWR
ncbi:hypothetical protein K1719_023367 [Acacia pycnantha]|nr:hypothetical protein K1719_023367 [Acacia pycnantha]